MSVESSQSRLLVVDDEADHCDLLRELLEEEGHAVTAFTSALQALDQAGREDFDLALTDLDMPEMSGLLLCERLIGTRPDLPVVVVTGQGSMDTAIAAIRAGAYDFILKPVEPKLLTLCVARALAHRRLQAEVKRLRDQAPAGLGALVGESPALKRVHDLIGRVGPSDASVLITGESGTGKEVVARGLHAASPRRERPFVAVNCAAVPASLIESELFGHARGAFTDAKQQRSGLFVQAHGGTLFLDEIGEMPLQMQPKLLRALQERTVRPVGANEDVPFDVRVLAATNRDLEHEIHGRRFREDLYYRINVVTISLPPLRECGSDVLTLAHHFIAKQAARARKALPALSPQVAEKLLAYDWPGNVRELENTVERMLALARFDQLTVEDLPEKIRAYRSDRFVLGVDNADEILTLEEVSKRYTQRVLKLVGGNKSRAADVLGVDRRTLYRRMDRWDAEARGEPIPDDPDPI